MMKTVTGNISKILNEKMTEADKVYDPAVEAETVTKYLEKVEKSLYRTNDLLKNSKLQELIAAHKRLDSIFKCCKMQDHKIQHRFRLKWKIPCPVLKDYVMFKKLTKK